MGWIELLGWLKVMHRQQKGTQASPDSWAGADQDPFWTEARRKREEERQQ